MPRALLQTIDLTLVERENRARQQMFISFTNASAPVQEIELTLTDDALRAASMTERSTGVAIDVGFVNDTLERIPPIRLLTDVVLSESINAEADTLTFQRAGRDLTPWKVAPLRGARPVEAWMFDGAAGAENAVKIFDGYFGSAEFDGDVATITCFDEAINLAQKTATLNLTPNHGLTLMEIIQQLCDTYGLTLGEVDLGEVGDRPRTKPLQFADEPLLELFRKLCSVAGADVWIEGRRLVAKRYNEDESPVYHLTSRNWTSLVVALPDVGSKNFVTAVTVTFDTPDASGNTAEITERLEYDDYAPAGGVLKIDNAGNETVVSMSLPLAYRLVSRTRTTTTKRGATPVRVSVEQYGYHSRRCAGQQIETDDSITPYVTGHALAWYKYADGKFYLDPFEQFRLKSHTVKEVEVDAEDQIIGEVTTGFGWHWWRRPIWKVTDPDPLTLEFQSINPIPITDEGMGLVFQAEIFSTDWTSLNPTGTPITRTTLSKAADDDGFVMSEDVTGEQMTIGEDRIPNSLNAYVYDVGKTIFTNTSTDALRETFHELTIFEPINESSYQVTVENDDEPTSVETVSGTRDALERIEPESRSQELRVEHRDEVRIFLNGEQVETIHAEVAENDDELELIAAAAVRKWGGWPVAIEKPIDQLIRKGRYIEVTEDSGDLGLTAARMFVEDVTWNFGPFTKSIAARYTPPELV